MDQETRKALNELRETIDGRTLAPALNINLTVIVNGEQASITFDPEKIADVVATGLVDALGRVGRGTGAVSMKVNI